MPDLGGFDVGRATWAILLSVAFWLLVQTELNPERSDVFDLAVEPTNVPAGLIVVNQADWRAVQVRLAAPRDVFSQLRASQLRAYVDVKGAGPGQASFPVEVPAPDPLVRVSDPVPARVTVRLEELARKTVPVRATLDGSPPFGYRPGRATLNPSTITISGPTSFVRQVESATVDVRLEGVTTDVNVMLPPLLLDGQGERVAGNAPGAEITPASVQAQVPITQQVSYKEVGVRPVVRGSVPPGYWVQSVSVDPAVVTAIAEPRVLGTVDAIDTDPIDLTGVATSFTRPVALQVPGDIVLARSDQPLVSVQIAALTMRQSIRVPVRVLNTAPGLFLASDVPIVEIVANGPTDQGLSAADVQANVDTSGLDAGSYSLPVRFMLPERFQVEQLQPASVPVVLREATAAASTLTPAPTTPPATAESLESSPSPLPTASAPPAPSPTATEAIPGTLTATPARTQTAVPRTPTRTPTPRPTATER
jgi:YbbR domain-containing protein